jgi:hypothetical protein
LESVVPFSEPDALLRTSIGIRYAIEKRQKCASANRSGSESDFGKGRQLYLKATVAVVQGVRNDIELPHVREYSTARRDGSITS